MKPNTGKQLEGFVQAACDYYRSLGVAMIDRIQTGTTKTRDGKLIFTRRVYADFYGMICPTGKQPRPILVECKSSNRISPKTKPESLFKKDTGARQIETLKEWERLGGDVRIVVENVLPGRNEYYMHEGFDAFRYKLDFKSGMMLVQTKGATRRTPISYLDFLRIA